MSDEAWMQFQASEIQRLRRRLARAAAAIYRQRLRAEHWKARALADQHVDFDSPRLQERKR